MSEKPERLDWVENVAFHLVVKGIDHVMNQKIRALFLEVNSGADPRTQQRYASIKFNADKYNDSLVEFIRSNKLLFADAYVSIWGSSAVNWAEYFVPPLVLSMVNDLEIGLKVGFGADVNKRSGNE